MTADQRVTAARAYLTEANAHDVAALPRTALLAVVAGLLRQLTEVLAAVTEMEFTLADAESAEDDRAVSHIDPDGGVWFTPADARAAVDALREAAVLRDGVPMWKDTALAARYRSLAGSLKDGPR